MEENFNQAVDTIMYQVESCITAIRPVGGNRIQSVYFGDIHSNIINVQHDLSQGGISVVNLMDKYKLAKKVCVPPSSGSSQIITSMYLKPSATSSIYYVNSGNCISHFYEKDGQFNYIDLSVIFSEYPKANAYGISSFFLPPNNNQPIGEQHVYYTDVNQHISHIWYARKENGRYTYMYEDVNVRLKSAPKAADAPIVATCYEFTSGLWQRHIYYVDENHHLSHIWQDVDDGSFHYEDITKNLNAPDVDPEIAIAVPHTLDGTMSDEQTIYYSPSSVDGNVVSNIVRITWSSTTLRYELDQKMVLPDKVMPLDGLVAFSCEISGVIYRAVFANAVENAGKNLVVGLYCVDNNGNRSYSSQEFMQYPPVEIAAHMVGLVSSDNVENKFFSLFYKLMNGDRLQELYFDKVTMQEENYTAW